jgi:hypothetical protein
MNKPKILVETDSRGIRKVTLESANGEAGLRLLKNSLPALRMLDAMIPSAYETGGNMSPAQTQQVK